MQDAFYLTRLLMETHQQSSKEFKNLFRRLEDLFHTSPFSMEHYKRSIDLVSTFQGNDDIIAKRLDFEVNTVIFPFLLSSNLTKEPKEQLLLLVFLLECEILGNWFLNELDQAESEEETLYIKRVFEQYHDEIRAKFEPNQEILKSVRVIQHLTSVFFKNWRTSKSKTILEIIQLLQEDLLILNKQEMFSLFEELKQDSATKITDFKEIKKTLEERKLNYVEEVIGLIDDIVFETELNAFLLTKSQMLKTRIKGEEAFKCTIRQELQNRQSSNGKRHFWSDLNLFTDTFCNGVEKRIIDGKVQLCFVIQQFVHNLGEELEAFNQAELEAARMGEWITIANAAKMLKCSEKTIKNKLDAEELIGKPKGKTRLVSLQSVKNYLNEVGPYE